MEIKKTYLLLFLLCTCIGAFAFRAQLRQGFEEALRMIDGSKTVRERLTEYGDAVRGRLSPFFEDAGVAYPTQEITLIGLKAERILEVWVKGADGEWRFLRAYPILGISGVLGPKLREGDLQAPEGLYRVESLNPNSRYHLALRVNYPNADDRRRGEADGRTNLGGDIMIHGKTGSIGCLAMGDEAIEDLFVLAAETGIDHISIILSPVDFRESALPEELPELPAWIDELYDAIKTELEKYESPIHIISH